MENGKYVLKGFDYVKYFLKLFFRNLEKNRKVNTEGGSI